MTYGLSAWYGPLLLSCSDVLVVWMDKNRWVDVEVDKSRDVANCGGVDVRRMVDCSEKVGISTLSKKLLIQAVASGKYASDR